MRLFPTGGCVGGVGVALGQCFGFVVGGVDIEHEGVPFPVPETGYVALRGVGGGGGVIDAASCEVTGGAEEELQEYAHGFGWKAACGSPQGSHGQD